MHSDCNVYSWHTRLALVVTFKCDWYRNEIAKKTLVAFKKLRSSIDGKEWVQMLSLALTGHFELLLRCMSYCYRLVCFRCIYKVSTDDQRVYVRWRQRVCSGTRQFLQCSLWYAAVCLSPYTALHFKLLVDCMPYMFLVHVRFES